MSYQMYFILWMRMQQNYLKKKDLLFVRIHWPKPEHDKYIGIYP